MIDSLKKILQFFGIDRAVGFGMLARMWGVVAGPISILIVVARFSKVQQGFYYTFSSILGLQIFFELGLLFVIAQFVSHEFVHLKWGEKGRIEGNQENLDRFNDLLCKTVRWFSVASLLMIVGLVPAGLYFFGQGQDATVGFAWQLPWMLAVLGTALNLFVTPFFAVVMGSGDVITVNYREMIGTITSSCLAWLVIGVHGGLYAIFAATSGNIIISWSYMLKEKPELLRIAWRGIFGHPRVANKESGLSWREEIWPMQWRMAVSSGSAYFIFQLFNPILFHYQGAVVAGQMGMTLSLVNALLSICMTMISAKIPEFGKLIAVRDWKNLDRLFYLVLRQSTTLAVFGSFAGWAVIWYLQGHYLIGQRFIPAQHAAILLGAMCVQNASGAYAAYLRAHKREPLMVMTVIASILQGAATWFLGMHFSTFGITVGYLSVMAFFVFPVAYLIWYRCRLTWHSETMASY